VDEERGSGLIGSAVDMATEAAETVRTYMASEQGRRLRRGVAAVLIVGAPLVSELPIIRKSPMAKLLRAAGLVTLVVKGAEWLRDWEPTLASETL
jgi:hypothetical protein